MNNLIKEPKAASHNGSVVLVKFMAERQALQAIKAASNGATETIASSDQRIIQLLGSTETASGMRVNSDSAMRVSSVYACVRLIAGAISSMPVDVYKKDGVIRKKIEDDPLWWLLNEEPTPRFTSAAMWEQVVSQMLLKESGFVYMGRSNSGAVRELIPLPYDACRAYRTEDGKRLRYSIQDIRKFGADQDDVLHFPGFGFDGLKALSVIQYAARNATGNAMAMDEYSGKFFSGGAHPSLVLMTDKMMKDDQINSLKQQFADKYSGIGNAHQLPLVLTEGIKHQQVSINAEDAQLLDARKFQVVDIARAFGVPPHMIGETSQASSWGTGLEQMAIGFVRYTIQPHLVRIEQELNRKLYKNAGRFLAFSRDSAMEGDSKAMSELFKAALGGPGSGPGYMSVDEARQRKNLPPLKGKYAVPFFPESNATPEPGAAQESETQA